MSFQMSSQQTDGAVGRAVWADPMTFIPQVLSSWTLGHRI